MKRVLLVTILALISTVGHTNNKTKSGVFDCESDCIEKRQYFVKKPESPTVLLTDRFGKTCPKRLPFTNLPNGLTGKVYGFTEDVHDIFLGDSKRETGVCNKELDGITYGEFIIEYYLPDGNLYAVEWDRAPQYTDERIIPSIDKSGEIEEVCESIKGCWWFSDGEVWTRTDNGMSSISQGFKRIRGPYEYENEKNRLAEIEEKRLSEKALANQMAYQEKVRIFRSNISVGDRATAGLVIEIKGNLVKIQANNKQCTQKNSNGECLNWINTLSTKWVKRTDLFPYE